LSGFHALVSSGTTPKMIARETDILPVGYGAMLLEGFVSVTALIAACALEPGDYFKINIAQDKYAAVSAEVQATSGLDMRTKEFEELQRSTGESNLAGKTGGAVTLAVGMAKVFSQLPGMASLMGYWYHFVIMFEALFILTLLETGTRVARFIFQETVQQFLPQRLAHDRNIAWALNVSLSVAVCGLWGYLLYSGNIATLWRMMGIANQLLATIALAVGTTYLLRYASRRAYALCTGIPLVFVVATVFAAGVQSIQSWWQELAGMVPGSPEAFYLKLVCILAGIMLVLSALVVLDSVRQWYLLLRLPRPESVEALPMPATEVSPP
jgi:carbon starvation protein